MGTLGKDFKYKVIKNFLTKEETLLLKDYCVIKHRLNVSNFENAQSDIMDTCFYGDPLMESLLINKRSLIEKESNLKLLPTYAFWRMYTLFADLKKHQDRPSCEVSATVVIDSDGTSWPIFMDGKPLDLEIGDAAIYLGMEVKHWREEFKGDRQSQVFLHYVKKEGKHKEHVKDKRPLYGMPRSR